MCENVLARVFNIRVFNNNKMLLHWQQKNNDNRIACIDHKQN